MKKLEDRYVKLSHREHILQRPETYIGSTVTELKKMFIVEDINDINNISIVSKMVHYNPGFIKIFDEIITNASDHYIRTNKVKKIKIDIHEDHIVVENDGPGIPVEMHKEENIYIPELIFGHLLKGENYEERIVGGRNGYGAKLTNTYSTKFLIETSDGTKKYKQEFKDNLSVKCKPKITKCKKEYTKITFYPDFEKFDLTEITEELQQIILKRCVDIAVYCPKIKVSFNGNIIPVKSFKDYIKMYVEDEDFYYEKIDDSWEIGVSKSEDDIFEQMSMVNGISTHQGGTHVNFITKQISKGVSSILNKKHKNINIKESDIKRNLFVFVNSKVVNPSFDTQTKENLITKMTQKHTKDVIVSDKFLKQLASSEIMESILRYIEAKEKASMSKESGKKVSKVRIKKLDDANKAGTTQSQKCLLFLTEGDSALSTALSGFAVTGRDYYGAFPLKGKPLNVRDIPMEKIKNNEEIKNIVSALGLEYGKKYTSSKDLRYGKVVIMSDQDLDGYHIKGLLINFFDTFWPELLKIDFLYEFITPIIKISKGKQFKYFYHLDDYNKWKNTSETKGFFIKYYKGLGTIEPKESKRFFKNIDKHLIRFNYCDEDITEDIIDLAFNKKRSDDRKEWLLNYNPKNIIDKFNSKTTIHSFIDDELIEFSMSDNIRSIPSLVDGLKVSQRKVLYTLISNNYKNETKVSQLSGSVMEKSAYHHGPVSLEQSVVGMAQNFVGSNNINLLEPNGQFGTRISGGKDNSASRYIFTKLNKITNVIFDKNDSNVLTYNFDDGKKIEPEHYIPVIPMLLVNGAKGVGTGYSTDIPKFNPKDIIKYYENILKGKKVKLTMIPWYKGFKGEISWDEEKGRYYTKGTYRNLNATTIQITELPIGTWNDKYFDHLDKLIDNKIIKDYTKNCTDTEIDIVVNIGRDNIKNIDSIDDTFNLVTYLSLNNMNALDEHSKIKKYKNHFEILDDFLILRLNYYKLRKEDLLCKLNLNKKILLNRIKFIRFILDDDLDLKNKKRSIIEKSMLDLKLEKVDDSFDYLLNMNFLSLSNEKLHDLKNSYENKKKEISVIEETTIEQMWFTDLENVKKML